MQCCVYLKASSIDHDLLLRVDGISHKSAGPMNKDTTKKSDNVLVISLKGVGPQMALKLAKVHVHTVEDVLFHLPHRYEDRTHVTDLGALLPNLSTVVMGQIDLAQVVFGRRRSLLVRISDGTGS